MRRFVVTVVTVAAVLVALLALISTVADAQVYPPVLGPSNTSNAPPS